MRLILVSTLIMISSFAPAVGRGFEQRVDDDYAYLSNLYEHLHAHPELSFQEEATSRRMAAELTTVGFDVTENVGGFGVVGVLENGTGPTVLIRTDTDALPVKEQTGLDYASTARGVEQTGQEVDLMHACGHDIHMSVWTGTARRLVAMKGDWSGTLVMIAQPAEERGAGARLMLADGLFERFPRPDYNLALHVAPDLPAGTVGVTSGFGFANVDSVDITIHGVGGHGAYPHMTKDPVTLAAYIITSLQTLVSREVSPLDPAVVTVGSIHGGAKHNVISDRVTLQLTVRSYSDAVRKTLLDGIARIAEHEAKALGFPNDKMPEVMVKDEFTPSLYNNPALVDRLRKSFVATLGADNVLDRPPVMGGEDFSRYGREDPAIPSLMFRLGTISNDMMQAAEAGDISLPSLHSPFFAPLPEPSIKTGVRAMTAAALELFSDSP